MTRFPSLRETLTGERQQTLSEAVAETKVRIQAARRRHQTVAPIQNDLTALQTRRLMMEVGRG